VERLTVLLLRITRAVVDLILVVVLIAGIWSLWPFIKSVWGIVVFLRHIIPC